MNPNNQYADEKTVFQWFSSAFRKLSFKGRARRKEFWSYAIFYMIFNVLAWLTFGSSVSFIFRIATLIMFPSFICVCIRRLHDTGRSALWYIMSLVLIAAGVVAVISGTIPLVMEIEKNDPELFKIMTGEINPFGQDLQQRFENYITESLKEDGFSSGAGKMALSLLISIGICLIYWLILMIFYALPGNRGENKYGSDPKKPLSPYPPNNFGNPYGQGTGNGSYPYHGSENNFPYSGTNGSNNGGYPFSNHSGENNFPYSGTNNGGYPFSSCNNYNYNNSQGGTQNFPQGQNFPGQNTTSAPNGSVPYGINNYSGSDHNHYSGMNAPNGNVMNFNSSPNNTNQYIPPENNSYHPVMGMNPVPDRRNSSASPEATPNEATQDPVNFMNDQTNSKTDDSGDAPENK